MLIKQVNMRYHSLSTLIIIPSDVAGALQPIKFFGLGQKQVTCSGSIHCILYKGCMNLRTKDIPVLLAGVGPTNSRNMSVLCQKCVRNLSVTKICQKTVRNVSVICQKSVSCITLSEICQIIFENISKMCQLILLKTRSLKDFIESLATYPHFNLMLT